MNTTLRVILSCLAALLVFLLLRQWMLYSYNVVYVDIKSSTAGAVRIFHAGGRAAYSDSFSQKLPIPAQKRTVLRFLTGNGIVEKLRIDPGNGSGRFFIYSVRMLSFFSSEIRFQPAKMATIVASPGVTLERLDDGTLVVNSSGDDPWVSFPELPKPTAPVSLWVTPCVAGFFVFLFLPQLMQFRPLCWRDTFDRRPSTGVNFDALDGLRGLAALSVFLTHSGAPFCFNSGVVGVVIFFSMSGFLLALPFTRESSLALSGSYMKGFYERRLRRIVPMFYAYLIVAYWFGGQPGDLVRSLLFLQGNHILWTIIQEMHFYLLFPVIIITCHLLFRGRFLWTGLFLLALSLFSEFGGLPRHSIFGDGTNQPLQVWTFLSGMAIAWFFKAPEFSESSPLRRMIGSNITGVALVLLLLWSPALHFVQYGTFSPEGRVWIYFSFFPLAVALFLLHILFSPGKMMASLLTVPPLRLLGTISYSFYLVHPSAIKAGRMIASQLFGAGAVSAPSLVLGLFFTVVLSAITYALIERPFMGRH